MSRAAQHASNVIPMPPQSVPVDALASVMMPTFLHMLRNPQVITALREVLGERSAPRTTRRQMRGAKGWTTEQLSRETGGLISASCIGHYETGRFRSMGNRNLAGLDALCRALGCTRKQYLEAGTE